MPNDSSTQVCGCDSGADYFCNQHKLTPIKDDVHYILKHVVLGDNNYLRQVHSRLYEWSKS